MTLLPIVLFGHPALRQQADAVQSDDDLGTLIDDMFATMRNAHGIGLAANQVSILKRVIVIDISDLEGYADLQPLALINPEILHQEGELAMEEGCLSIPTVRDEVVRSEKIRIRYRDSGFNGHELDAEGVLARVILHEIDHLNGVLFLDHLTPGRRKFHKGALTDIKKGELEIPYPVIRDQSK